MSSQNNIVAGSSDNPLQPHCRQQWLVSNSCNTLLMVGKQRIANFTIAHRIFQDIGHSTISAAATKVLDKLFPNEHNYFDNRLVEASMSRFCLESTSKKISTME